MQNQSKVILALLGVTILGTTIFLVHKKVSGDSAKSNKNKNNQLVGKQVFTTSEGYVNVRKSPEVKNSSWSSRESNLLKKAIKNPVGKILERVKGHDGHNWYSIRLNGSNQNGFVREDAIKII